VDRESYKRAGPSYNRGVRTRLLTTLLLLAGSARADWIVATLEGEPQRGISLAVEDWKVALTPAGEATRHIAAEEIVEISAFPPPRPPPPSAAPFEVQLLDGTRLRGVPESAAGGALRLRTSFVRTPEGEPVLLPERIRELRRVAGAEIPGASRLVRVPGRDAAYQLSGARTEGFVESFLATGVRIDRSPLEPREIAYDDLAAIFFDNPPEPPPEGLRALVRLSDGGAVVSGGRGTFRIGPALAEATTPGGLELRIPLEGVTSIGFQGGRFVHLSDLAPLEVKRVPFFAIPEGPFREALLDFVCPVRADRSPDGRPITLLGRRYDKGIGVRPYTELTYALDGGFREFRAVCGVDDEVLGPEYGRASGTGSVVFRVLVDGKLVAETDVLKGGGDPATLRVDIRGARRITLVAALVPPEKAPSGGSDTPELDNAVWARPILVR
jgi:hypothetical protein